MAGGLAQYLGVDATVLRVGFIIASLLFLGGFGGPILYIIAWIIVPEEGKDAPVTRAAFSGRPWHDWDRSARSWALVLGALALALIWSFGVWPWWHWRVLPFWLVGVAVVLWLLARHRDGNWVSSPPAAPPAWGGQAGPGPAPGTGSGAGPGPASGGAPGTPSPGKGPATYGPYTPSSEGPATPAAASVTTMTVPLTANPGLGADPIGPEPGGEPNGSGANGNGPYVPVPDGNGSGSRPAWNETGWDEPGGNGQPGPAAGAEARPAPAPVLATAPANLVPTAPNGLMDPHELSDADRAAAASAAADWAAGQLALAGVPSKSGNGTSGSAPALTNPARGAYPARVVRRVVRVLMALMVALVLLAVLTVVGVTLGTGSSLRGGAGRDTYAPANVSAVQSHYRLGAGNLDLNLAAVKFPSTGKTIDVTVGVGRLTVEVPNNTVINLQARSGLGQVDVFGQTASNVQETYYAGTATSTSPRLNLNAHVGIGSIQVSQGWRGSSRALIAGIRLKIATDSVLSSKNAISPPFKRGADCTYVRLRLANREAALPNLVYILATRLRIMLSYNTAGNQVTEMPSVGTARPGPGATRRACTGPAGQKPPDYLANWLSSEPPPSWLRSFWPPSFWPPSFWLRSFWPGLFLAGAFLAATFLAVVFLAVVFLAAVFFAAVFLTPPAPAREAAAPRRRPRPPPGPSASARARRSASSSAARSMVSVSTLSPRRNEAFTVPSVT